MCAGQRTCTYARDTVAFLARETPQFIGPNTPNLNLADYRVWGVMQQRVYRTPIQDVDELKQRLILAWSGLQQSVIDKAIDLHTVIGPTVTASVQN